MKNKPEIEKMQKFREYISEILHDNTSGSAEILEKTIQALLDLTEKNTSVDYRLLEKELMKLFGIHGNFAILFHFLNALFLSYKKESDIKDLKLFLENYRVKWKGSPEKVAGQFLAYIGNNRPDSILFHSNSSALQTLCNTMAEKKYFPEIYQTLSGPANEGRIQASKPWMKNFRVIFFHESAAARFIPEIDCAIFGADLISDDFFINKTGTYPLALLFREFKKPVYVLADSRKIIANKSVPASVFQKLTEENPKDPAELWPGPPQNITPLNYYFEKIPNCMVNAFFGEEGVMDLKHYLNVQKTAKLFT